jgi:hypothetical protein
MKYLGCWIPLVLIVAFGIIGGLIGAAMNNVQLGACAVPSSQFVNAEACREMITNAKGLYIGAAVSFGAFFGFMLGLVFYMLIGRKLNAGTLDDDHLILRS